MQDRDRQVTGPIVSIAGADADSLPPCFGTAVGLPERRSERQITTPIVSSFHPTPAVAC